MTRSILVLTVVAAVFFSVPASARPLVPDDVYRIRDVSDAQLSPDGQWVAYTVSSVDRDQDENTSDLWMSNFESGEELQLTRTPASEHFARWSPDGRMLAFLSDRDDEDKGDQIWILDMRGGEAKKLTAATDGITGFDWSPDGKRIVYVGEVAPQKTAAAQNAGDSLVKPDKTDGKSTEEKDEPIVIDRLYFKEDVTGYLGEERSHLFLLDVDDGTVVPLTDGEFNETQPAWSPDGKHIAFVTKRGEDMDRHDNWDVYVIEAKAGAVARQITRNPGADGDGDAGWDSGPPAWSPDGKRIAYLHGGAPEDIWYGLLQVGLVASRGGEAELPTSALDRNTISPRFAADGNSIYFLLEDDRSVQLAEAGLRDQRVERLTAPGRVVYGFSAGKAGRLALVMSSPDQPAEVWKLERGRLQQLSHQNDALLGEVQLAQVRSLSVKSADDLDIHGLVMRPPGVTKAQSLPAVLRIHGGPVAQYQYEFDFEWQVLAANGYLVAGVNPRGSSGRGYAFQKMLYADWGFADVPDVLAAVDYLVDSKEADPDRLGVGGWSYGGILTNYVIASTNRFKAATSGSGMSNMLGGYGIDQYVRSWEAELGTPWENSETWLRLSYPFLHADRISTPTLFMCGAADFNVPLAASEQMFQALKSLGVPTRLVIYPEQYHSLTRASFRVDRYRRYLEWYDEYLK